MRRRPRAGRRSRSPTSGVLDALALGRVGAGYWLGIYPQVRHELAAWEDRARAIPHEMLRGHALGQLTAERLNPEAAALFAVLAPRERRRSVVSLIVAYQVLYDYLDALNEEPGLCELRHGLQLHRALTDAVLPSRPMGDYFMHHPELRGGADGGYLHALAGTCRRIVQTLPAAPRVAKVLTRATARCAQAQSHNHARLAWGEARLIDWSLAQTPDRGGYLWWEIAAGGISCLAVHALLCCAADPASAVGDAAQLDAAYFPSICALSTLLDSLADYHRDRGTTNHSFVSHYRDGDHASERLAAIAGEASERIEPLRQSRLHAIILAGIVSYYLSCPSVGEGFPAATAERLTRHLGAQGTLVRATLRARRRLHAGEISRRAAPSAGEVVRAAPTPGEPAAPAPARR